MRIARLDLVAFGPFTDKSLDFSGGSPGGLHLIFGRNAAGKSSALRAIADLLFGIPSKSVDDHVHPYQSLRIRALLESTAGERVLVQRLKRNKDSLRDEHDSPLDEVVLKRLLGSVDRALFERVFGLDHERLRDAGQALLEGGGDVGESLFDAGAGGHGVRRVLARLRDEAERLFKPRGGKQEIPQLLESYREARERVRLATHPPEAYVEQQRELDRCRTEHEELAQKLSDLRRERESSRLLQAAMRSVAQREKLLGELRSLGALPDLPLDFGQRREHVQRTILSAQGAVAAAQRDIERLTRQAAELHPPEGLLNVADETVMFIREGIGSTKKALADLPLREAALAERRVDAQAAERRLGIDSARLTPAAIRARRPEESKFRKLLAARGALAERQRASRDTLRRVELDCETRKARLSALPPARTSDALERTVLLARHVGDVEALLLAVRRERAEQALLSKAELAMMAPFDGSLAELCALRVPASETVLRFEQGFAAIEEQRNRLADMRARCRERAAELERELAAEERAGAVPSEAELERARKSRDERFDELCKAWPDKGSKTLTLFEAARLRDYRGAVSEADALADRLRREAARVAENARRAAELTQLASEQAQLASRESELVADKQRLEQEWASSWAAAGFEPVRPTEMRGWLARRERAVALVVKDAALSEQEAELERKARELEASLIAALGELPCDTPLAVCVERAQERLEQERALAQERASLQALVAELEVRRTAALRDLERAEQESSEHEREIQRAIAALGFEDSITAEEVDARLDALAELVTTREQTAELQRRIDGMKRDITAFQSEVDALVQAHAPDLVGVPADRAALELVKRYDNARRDAARLDGIRLELEERRAEFDEQQARLTAAQSEADALLSLAAARDLTELSSIEQRTQRGRELRAELDGLEATLTGTAGARGLEALLQQASATDPARLAARLEELDQEIEQLEEDFSNSIRRQQSVQAGLDRFSDTSAIDAAEEERALASALVVRSERWAKLKLAEVLLAREIERYREQNQGPVLRRAAELFARLTDGQYRGLRVGREERTLVAVRSNDLEVTVAGLNEAARYHLYLALRLASLERYLEHAEPLPLVLDDVLIHFDDDGARAALGALGELGERTQILLFTHHRHNIELAKRAVPNRGLFLYEL